MRIAFVLPEYPLKPSGGAIVVFKRADWLAAHGHDVTIFYASHWGNASGIVSWRAIVRQVQRYLHSFRHNGQGPVWHRFTSSVSHKTVVRAPRFSGFDTVIATYWSTLAANPDMRWIHFVQGVESWACDDVRLTEVMGRNCPKIAVSGYVAEDVRRRNRAADVRIIRNGVDLSIFRPADFVAFRKSLCLTVSDNPVKGTRFAVEVLARVREAIPEVSVIAFGVGRRPDVLPRWVDYFEALTPHQIAERVYQKSSVFLSTSLSEGWSLPVLEAMACGTVVVTSDSGGVRDFAVNEINCKMRDHGDVEGFANATIELMEDPGARDWLSAAGLLTAQGLDWDSSHAEFESAIVHLRADRG